VGWFDLDGPGRFHEFGRTTAWNWQQGCRLRWHPAEPDRWAIHNVTDGEGSGAVVVDVENGRVIRRYPAPFYDVSSDGRWALTLDFHRLHRHRPGYGHAAARRDPAPHESPDIWRIDLESGDATRILELDEIRTFEPTASMAGGDHYVNHLSWSPGARRFVVLHLWHHQGRRLSRLLVADADGSGLHVLDSHDHASHHAWRSDDELLAFVTHAPAGARYHLHLLPEGAVIPLPGAPSVDGHPSFRPGHPDHVLTDTYPDRYGDRLLILMEGEDARVLGRFYTPPRYSEGPVRCDLHPRWDRAGDRICLDSTHSGERAMYVLELADLPVAER
jgi:hypothetical protein